MSHEDLVTRTVENVQHWLPRFDVITIGPGLGRDGITGDAVVEVCGPITLQKG